MEHALRKASVLCSQCEGTFLVKWRMRELGTRFTVPVRCPYCAAIHDDVDIGAEEPPEVLQQEG
jgi:hypothetical protein